MFIPKTKSSLCLKITPAVSLPGVHRCHKDTPSSIVLMRSFLCFPKLPVAQKRLCLKKKFLVADAEIFLFSKKIYAVYAGGSILCGNKTILICSRQLLTRHAVGSFCAPEAAAAHYGAQNNYQMCPPNNQRAHWSTQMCPKDTCTPSWGTNANLNVPA